MIITLNTLEKNLQLCLLEGNSISTCERQLFTQGASQIDIPGTFVQNDTITCTPSFRDCIKSDTWIYRIDDGSIGDSLAAKRINQNCTLSKTITEFAGVVSGSAIYNPVYGKPIVKSGADCPNI